MFDQEKLEKEVEMLCEIYDLMCENELSPSKELENNIEKKLIIYESEKIVKNI